MSIPDPYTVLDRALKGGPLEEAWIAFVDEVAASRTPDMERLQLLEQVIGDVKRMT